jgi:thioredoxin-like negative regulator of GroEL
VGLLAGLSLLMVGCASVAPETAVSGSVPGRYEPLPAGGFEQIVQRSSGPVVLLFESPNCPYCRALMGSVRKGVAGGKPWIVYTVDVFEDPALRQQFAVGPVPCLVYLKDGKEVDRSTGWRPGFVVSGSLNSFFQ